MAKGKNVGASKKNEGTNQEGVNGQQRKKTECPITLEEFEQGANDLVVTIAGQPMRANVKAPFSTGSFGWNTSGKIKIQVGDEILTVQVGLNLTVVGSKEAPRD